MSTNKRARRAPDASELIAELIAIATSPQFARVRAEMEPLELLCRFDQSLVRREAERQMRVKVGTAWRGGWLPSELARQVRRTTDSVTTRLALVAIGADHVDRAASTLHPRWFADLELLGLPAVASGAGWLDEWERRTHIAWPDTVRAVVTLLRCLAKLGRLPVIVPPPGSDQTELAIHHAIHQNDPMLDRVRALLAQAESTTFDAEADAFTAKAQQLMTRHAIDAAILSTRAQNAERPTAVRIAIDEPYVEGKSLLLQHVAEHSRCRSVIFTGYAMSSIVGLAEDIAATELLFTSLLVQAQRAMQATAATSAAGSQARSRSFRSSFLVAYAQRVGHRLEAINARICADVETETGTSIVPVLKERSALVDAVFDEMFGRNLSGVGRRTYDSAGLVSGRLAADRAQLNAGELASRRPAITAD